MKKKPRILITNDDGIHAPGIMHLAQSLREIGELFIVAPTEEKSGSSLGISFIHPIEVTQVSFPSVTAAWKVSGTPADCIKIGTMKLINKPIDFIVSGINRGSNAGRAVLYSGTLGGVIEGAFQKIPGIGFSCIDEINPNYEKFYPFIPKLVEHFLTNPLPQGTILNVNFPKKNAIAGVKMARQGMGNWVDHYEEILHETEDPKYLITGKWETQGWNKESDLHLLQEGYITAVPIHVYELTCQATLDQRKQEFDNLFYNLQSI